MSRVKDNTKKEKPVNKELPFPEVDLEYLESILLKIEELNGRMYSSLSYEEKKLVELSCARAFVTIEGKNWSSASKTKYHTLVYNNWFLWFVGQCYGEPIAKIGAKEFHVIEDEPMIVSNLEVTDAPNTNSPIYDAIINWPNNNPIRKFKDKKGNKSCVNSFYYSTGKVFQYRNKPNFLKNEIDYKDAPAWRVQEETPNNIRQFLISLGTVTPEEHGKISFIMETIEKKGLGLRVTKPDWAEFLGSDVSKLGYDDAEEYIQNLENPKIVNTKEEFLQSCQLNVYTILEM